MFALQIIAILIKNSLSQWSNQVTLLYQNITFTKYEGANATLYSNNFVNYDNISQTANFITCINPPISYITLNSTYPKVKEYYVDNRCSNTNSYCWYEYNYRTYKLGDFISFDLFFQGTWSNDLVDFKFGNFTYSYMYTSPVDSWQSNHFCDGLQYDVKQVNFFLPNLISQKLIISSLNYGNGQVSIRNFRSLTYSCDPFCKTCVGIKQNQCSSCYYGHATNGVCPPCPFGHYFSSGCVIIPRCNFILPLCVKTSCKFCQTFGIFSDSIQNLTERYLPTFLQWTIIYDPQFIDQSLTSLYHKNVFFYGIFKYSTGISKYVNLPSTSKKGYYVGVQINLYIFNDIPLDCGISFKFNLTYYGSIYRNNSGIQLHKFKYLDIKPLDQYSTYSTSNEYILYGYFDIPLQPIQFTAIGNYTYVQFYTSEQAFGWGFKSLQFFTHICTSYCLECDVSFKCKKCELNYYLYKDGTCISTCNFKVYQKVITLESQQYCQDFNDQTRYSETFVEELQKQFDLNYYNQYNLISQNGANFLKGPDTYFSFVQGYPILGGQYIWAQAKFSRTHENIDPHHSISIAFTLLYGPYFPSDGQFIFTIESNPPLIKSASSLSKQSDGTMMDKIFIENFSHSQNTLTVFLECFGPNNDPIFSYCGFYDYIVVVHYCQPYCLDCSDQYDCLQWNATYDSNLIKFSQTECQPNSYYEFRTFTCVPCSDSCVECLSFINCTVCKPTYTNSQLGCICKQNQYEEANQCFDCPIECKQCLNSLYCYDCYRDDNRILVNGQCLCQNGYYSVISQVKCLSCNQICGTCNGQTINDCLLCNPNISNIELIGSTCKCKIGYFYENSLNQCVQCHSSCLDCFDYSITGCLSCDFLKHRILKGLKCECEPGYYEQNTECINCPIHEDITLSNCYNFCQFDYIWHTQNCNQCNLGFELIQNECRPICGDSLITGYEQCEDGNNNIDDLCFNCQFQCPKHCLTCNQSTTLPCQNICGDQLVTGSEECDDGNNIQYDGCYNCRFQCQPQCTLCVKGKCQECETIGWQIDPSSDPWICKEICGDLYPFGNEQCDDGNFNDQDGCKNCKYFCRIGCTLCDYRTRTCLSCEYHGFRPKEYYCFPIENDGILVTDPYGYVREVCDSQQSSSCSHECQQSQICQSCVDNKCVDCAVGQNLINDFCQPICGDSRKVANEHCDDGLILPYKGCQNCLPKCQVSCQTCDNQGLGCLACNFGYQIIDNLCYTICGDMFITSDEECDDGNLIQQDGCHFCQFSCQDFCLNCINGKCYECKEGYLLFQTQCLPIHQYASQKYPTERYEFLVDNSINIQDTFNLCQIQLENIIQMNQISNRFQFEQVNQYCQLTLSRLIDCNQLFLFCINCNFDQCLECQRGYYLNYLFECISQCGDEILTENEECELNQINCINCFFKKPQFCLHYFSGICLECDYGYYFNTMMNSCESLCGDGIIAQDEERDENGECKYICSNACLHCQKGICFQCQQTYYLLDSQCFPDEEIVEYPSQIWNCLECLDIFEKNYLKDDIDFCVNQCEYNQQFNLIKKNTDNSNYNFNENQYHNNSIQFYSIECGNGIIEGSEQCDDQNLINDDNCNNLCELSCYPNCEICINGFCVKCEFGWKIEDIGCESLCGDSQIVGLEECDDGNNYNFDGCYECKYSCTQNCQICERGDCIECNQDFFMDEYKLCRAKQVQFKFGEQKDCAETSSGQCISCLYGFLEPITSIQCEDGYYGNACNDQIENPELYLNKNYKCSSNFYIVLKVYVSYVKKETICLIMNESFCGDGIIQGFEQCDDFNSLQYDGCFACQISCEISCYQCTFGKCQMCKQGYLLSSDSKCISNCGDGLILPYSNEQCDDGNTLEHDGCYNCKFECQPYCAYCNELQQCLKCQEGFQFKNDNCTPICGDGITIIEFEECDDANDQPYDGCYNCKYQCSENCEICYQGYCQDVICQLGMAWMIDSCSPICGDTLVVDIEECDDGNSKEFDGCFNCRFSCIENCKTCDRGSCLDCKSGFSLKDDKCVEIMSQKHYFADYQSIIQNSKNNWICQDQECTFSLSPNLKIEYLNQTFSKQYIKVYFDQEVKLKENNQTLQSQLFNIQLKNFHNSAYKTQINPIQEIKHDLLNVSYEIEIENLISFDEKLLLQIDLISDVINNNNQLITKKQIQIQLKYSEFLSDEKKQISLKAMTSNRVLMIGAISFSIISLISGESSFFLEMLDVLQYQSFLKFINVDYPENLAIYFSASEALEISSYLQIMQIDQIFNIITKKEESSEVDGKFKFYNVDPDFFTNILPQAIQTLVLLIILLLGNKYYQLLVLTLNQKNITNILSLNLNGFKLSIIKIFNKIRIQIKGLICIKSNFSSTHVRPFILINAWDLLLKVFISLRYIQFGGDMRNTIQYIISLALLCYYLYFILQQLKFTYANKKRLKTEQETFISFLFGLFLRELNTLNHFNFYEQLYLMYNYHKILINQYH
ncbi:unnamed protein product [Paramecium primaurelia]|uniref:EGF-like domain-containing protein n=1 Tax=Paramecium primaurelia TaxID=5886 RepID=A0A8S1NRX8_PARPR|nr:unnamed protein product [Paramecium primaurelia]